MKTPVYNMEGLKVEEFELPSKVFEVSNNSDLVHQVMVSQMGNKRIAIAHTKHRGEVSGGGKKPWAQKHTGRARHGSIRSPLWRKGGVAFGPRSSRVFTQKINTKMRRKALFTVLSQKAKENLVVLIDSFTLETPKTKILNEILKKLPSNTTHSLLVLSETNKMVMRAAKNIPFLDVVQAQNLNILDLLAAKFIIMPKESVSIIEKTFEL